MITVYLQGGIGNQCSQFAAGLSFAKKYGRQLMLNVSSFDGDPVRMYSLELFRGIREFPTERSPERVIHEPGLRYCPDIEVAVETHPDVMLRGYFQAHQYCASVLPELRQIFEPGSLRDCHEHTLAMIRAAGDRSVFVTVRRTDYVGNNFHGLLTLDYYRQAAQLVRTRIRSPFFFVFSDDPEWCGQSEELSHALYPMYVAGNYHRTLKPNLGREDCELYLMSQCRNAIMANSSYSCWGVYLNPNPGVVVAPRQWFGPGSNQDPEDIYCPDWIRI